MTVVERLAGSFVVRDSSRAVLVGQPKVPCAWESFGFAKPTAIDAPDARRAELVRLADVPLPGPRLVFTRSFESVVAAIESRMLVARNGSASERLWTLVLDEDDPDEIDESREVDADWIVDMPDRAFALIRDNVLRCI